MAVIEQSLSSSFLGCVVGRREVIQTYGYDYLFGLNNLEQIGLIRKGELNVFGSSGSSKSMVGFGLVEGLALTLGLFDWGENRLDDTEEEPPSYQ